MGVEKSFPGNRFYSSMIRSSEIQQADLKIQAAQDDTEISRSVVTNLDVEYICSAHR